MMGQVQTEQEMIDAFIRSGRMTRLPPAAVEITTAEIPADARRQLAAYRAALPADRLAWRDYNARVREQVRTARRALTGRRVGPPAAEPAAPPPAPPEPREAEPMDEFTSFPARPRPVLASTPPNPAAGLWFRPTYLEQPLELVPVEPPPLEQVPDQVEPPAAPVVAPGPAGTGIADITWDAGAGALRFLLTDGTDRLVAIPLSAFAASNEVGKTDKPVRPAKPKPVKGSWSR